MEKTKRKVFWIIVFIVLTIIIIVIPFIFHCNLLLYCGSVVGGIATLIAVVISTSHADYIEKRRRIPFLVISYESITLQEINNYSKDIPFKFFSENKDKAFINSDHFHKFSPCYEVENSVIHIAIQNIKKDIGVLDFSIKVEDDLIVNNKFIKPNEEFIFLLGCSADYLERLKTKEKDIHITYRYQSEDMDQKYEQSSWLKFCLEDDSPVIIFNEPLTSERTEMLLLKR